MGAEKTNQEMTMKSRILSGVAALLVATVGLAHGDHDGSLGHKKPPPLAVLQLDQVRDAASKYLDVAAAEADGYHDIGLFVPNMGWHYMKESILDANFEWTRPELLVYADDPCGGGKRRLVAVEYAVPFALAKRAPAGFAGAPTSGMRTRRSSCGRCTPGCTSSIRMACSRR
jgi:hypothetical protein